jgi:hypothetical protein
LIEGIENVLRQPLGVRRIGHRPSLARAEYGRVGRIP